MLRQLGSYAALKGGLLHDGDDGRPAVPAPSETTTPLLVPVFVTAQSGLDTALLRAGGPWGAAAAGTRLAAELGATAPQVGRVLAAQLATGTASCESQELGWGPRLAEIRLAVTVGRLRFCETLLWDVLHPHAQRVAADFAAQTCADLGLGCAGPVSPCLSSLTLTPTVMQQRIR